MKPKTYILTLPVRFPKGHPREGEETEFAEMSLFGVNGRRPYPCPVKIHTIRANYDLWKRRIDEVNAGRAVLSVRQWLGLPRRSKQRELFRFDRDSGIGVERLELNQWNVLDDDPERRKWYWVGIVAGRMTAVREDSLAANDGLTLEDWRAWFRDCDRSQPIAIIHFTKFRYCK